MNPQPSLRSPRDSLLQRDESQVDCVICLTDQNYRYEKVDSMESLSFVRTPSPVGPLFLAASEKGLVRLEFEGRVMKLDPRIELRESKRALAPFLRELDEYFAGERREFTIRSTAAASRVKAIRSPRGDHTGVA